MSARGGRAKAMSVPDTTKATLHKAIQENIRPGPTLCTDDNPSYNEAANRHLGVNHSAKEYVNEFTFRLNKGNCKLDTIGRIRALCTAMVGKRIKYREFAAPDPP